MANTSNDWNKKPREMFYFRQRYKNRVFNRLASFFANEAEHRGLTKKIIAERLNKDPAQITRWLSGPANLTMDTLSDLLFAMEAEPEPPQIVRLSEKSKPNYVDPLIADILGVLGKTEQTLTLEEPKSITEASNTTIIFEPEPACTTSR